VNVCLILVGLGCCSVICVMIGRWSELPCVSVFHVVWCIMLFGVAVMSGEVGCWCCVLVRVKGIRVCVFVFNVE